MLDKLSPSVRADVEQQLKGPGDTAPRVPAHKYGVAAAKDRTIDGVVFDSKLESRIWRRLTSRIDAARIERQVRYVLVPKQVSPKGVKHRSVEYVADFVIDGKHVVDAKGQILSDYVIKRKLMLHVHGIEIVELKNLTETDKFITSIEPT